VVAGAGRGAPRGARRDLVADAPPVAVDEIAVMAIRWRQGTEREVLSQRTDATHWQVQVRA
jgi:hypothetical protein